MVGSGKRRGCSSMVGNNWPQWLLPSVSLFFFFFIAVDLYRHAGECRSSNTLYRLIQKGKGSWQNAPTHAEKDVCKGRRIYMYSLPSDFNEDLVRKCHGGKSACTETWGCFYCGGLENFGMGPPVPEKKNTPPEMIKLQPPDAWLRTHQFVLEVLFHEKMKTYPCLTSDPGPPADAFYIPFYAGQDAAFSIRCPSLQVRDRGVHRLTGWLSAQAPWQRTHGQRHFMVLGRQPRDLNREILSSSWGLAVMSEPELANVTMMLWERAFSGIREIGIPYPTSFHPSSDEDLKLWQETIKNAKRPWLVSFLGSASRRLTQQHAHELRKVLWKQCEESKSKCLAKDCVARGTPCEWEPELVMLDFASSVFCLQPEGDSPTRKSVFDSMIAGCLPVTFSNRTAHEQYEGYLPREWRRYGVMIPEAEVMAGRVNVVEALGRISAEEVRRMQATLWEEIVPRLVYKKPGATARFHDAMDVALGMLFTQLAEIQAPAPLA